MNDVLIDVVTAVVPCGPRSAARTGTVRHRRVRRPARAGCLQATDRPRAQNSAEARDAFCRRKPLSVWHVQSAGWISRRFFGALARSVLFEKGEWLAARDERALAW